MLNELLISLTIFEPFRITNPSSVTLASATTLPPAFRYNLSSAFSSATNKSNILYPNADVISCTLSLNLSAFISSLLPNDDFVGLVAFSIIYLLHFLAF